MSYTAGSFVADEQPTTAKWNLLWANDASFNDGSGIGDNTIDSRHYVAGSIDPEHLASTVWGWEELGRHTLSSDADTLQVTSFTAKKYLKIHVFVIPNGAINTLLTFNNDTGNNYAYGRSNNGAADATTTSNANMLFGRGASWSTVQYGTMDVVNVASQPKLWLHHSVNEEGSGAANASSGTEQRGKWQNTSAQITRVDVNNTGAGSYASGSELIVLGKN